MRSLWALPRPLTLMTATSTVCPWLRISLGCSTRWWLNSDTCSRPSTPEPRSTESAKILQPRHGALEFGSLFNGGAHLAGLALFIAFEHSPPRDHNIASLVAKFDDFKLEGLAPVLLGFLDELGIDLGYRTKSPHALDLDPQAPLVDRIYLALDRHTRFIGLVQDIGVLVPVRQQAGQTQLVLDRGEQRPRADRPR